ncbi:hypothetical protein KR093_004314 [Drosophila rubida]|uniref:Uncharacterized protein n=1 Tax=Drosophila rubida TaxID=30044 RepID=A0AAD4KCU4_9MUSC|nr:hypothetical protein KR093_004314 [Drosophila rubida]
MSNLRLSCDRNGAETTSSASGSGGGSVGGSGSGSGRSDRESGTVLDNDHASLRSTRSRPLTRLDRLLRRWLPGYNYLRGPIVHSSSSSIHIGSGVGGVGGGRAERKGALSGRRSSACVLEQQRQQQQQQRHGSGQLSGAGVGEVTLPVQKRKDGEVLLDTGIAKSEFCMKLEKLLRAKLIVKE